MAVTSSSAPSASSIGWRLPIVLVLCGCAISVLTFGPRSSLGFFLTPLSQTNGWGRDVFALALAIQNLLWGLGQPLAGAIADKFGAPRVLCVGVVMYALGLYLTSTATTPGMLSLSAGVLVGFGLSGCAVPSVIGALGKLLPDSWRSIAFGAVTAAGSFGQFLFSPLAVQLMDHYGWQSTLVIFSCLLLLVIPLSLTLIPPRRPAGTASAAAPPQPLMQALVEAFGHRS
jgi:MFS family permease